MPIPEEGVIYAVARDVTAVHEADQRMREMSELLRVTERINSGVTLDDVIDSIHDGLRGTIPFNRLSVAMIDASRERVVSRWVRSDRGIRLGVGFSAPLRGSSLEAMVADPKPRILNDLPAHLVAHPESTSTALMVDEGMRSSLTCPLVVDGQTVGFLFFSSVESHRYENCHVTTYRHLAAQIAGMVEKARLYSELDSKTRYIEDQVEAVSRDLALARDLQQHLTPQAMPSLPNLDLSHLYEPASQVGGDILEVTRVDDNRVLVFLGDAMGHGVRSALVMSLTVALFQNEAEGDPDPAHICSRLNRKLYALLNNEFVTATCALFDATSCTADVVLAGHPSPLLLDARTQLIHTKQTDSMPLGIESTESFRSRRFELQPNDCLLFYTDGLIDARGRGREHFGRDRLLGHLLKCNGRSSRELVQTIREDLARHVGHRSLTDDVCIFAAKAL